MSKKTPLYDAHKTAKGKMIPFGDWLLPVSYQGTLAEHRAVREACGIFDVSHMGEIFVEGKEAAAYLQYMTINNIERLKPGYGQYSAILDENGGMIDDLILYRLKEDCYLICVNAANVDKDFSWFQKNQTKFDVIVSNRSEEFAQLAVQGPLALRAMKKILNEQQLQQLENLAYMQILELSLFSKTVFIARTGYTGEIGYELYLPTAAAAQTWDSLVTESGEQPVTPIGLGARDTLRLEACYLLYGNDMTEATTPLEAGIGWATKLDCGDFIGKNKIETQKTSGVARKIFAFKMADKGIARSHMDVYYQDKKIGKVTSGSVLPTVGGAGGMAMLNCQNDLAIGSKVEVDVRGQRRVAFIMKRPLYTAKVK